MRIIDIDINVISDDLIYITVTSKNVPTDSGDWLNYSKYSCRFKNLTRAMNYVSQMTRLLTDKDYHLTLNVVRV